MTEFDWGNGGDKHKEQCNIFRDKIEYAVKTTNSLIVGSVFMTYLIHMAIKCKDPSHCFDEFINCLKSAKEKTTND